MVDTPALPDTGAGSQIAPGTFGHWKLRDATVQRRSARRRLTDLHLPLCLAPGLM